MQVVGTGGRLGAMTGRRYILGLRFGVVHAACGGHQPAAGIWDRIGGCSQQRVRTRVGLIWPSSRRLRAGVILRSRLVMTGLTGLDSNRPCLLSDPNAVASTAHARLPGSYKVLMSQPLDRPVSQSIIIQICDISATSRQTMPNKVSETNGSMQPAPPRPAQRPSYFRRPQPTLSSTSNPATIREERRRRRQA